MDVLNRKEEQKTANDKNLAKAAYQQPVLTKYGELRTRTMASSPGSGESGDPLNYKLE